MTYENYPILIYDMTIISLVVYTVVYPYTLCGEDSDLDSKLNQHKNWRQKIGMSFPEAAVHLHN